MGCNNALLARFQVRIESSPFQFFPIKQVTSVSGLDLGEQGTVSLTEYNKIIEIPDNRRRLSEVGLTVRLDRSPTSLLVENFFREYWEDKDKKTYTILVDICNRAFKPFYTWTFEHCSIKSFKMPDMDLGSPRFAEISMSFTPYDVRLEDYVALSVVTNTLR